MWLWIEELLGIRDLPLMLGLILECRLVRIVLFMVVQKKRVETSAAAEDVAYCYSFHNMNDDNANGDTSSKSGAEAASLEVRGATVDGTHERMVCS